MKKSKIWEHVLRTHIRSRNAEEPKNHRGYFSPAEGCGKTFGHLRRKYKAHIADNKIHDVWVLPEAGVLPWQEGRDSVFDKNMTLKRLLTKRLVTDRTDVEE